MSSAKIDEYIDRALSGYSYTVGPEDQSRFRNDPLGLRARKDRHQTHFDNL